MRIHRPSEEEILIHAPAHVREAREAEMGRVEKRRLERAREDDEAEKRQYGGKLCTRKDVYNILALYHEQKIVPLAFDVSTLEAWMEYRTSPFWRRWWIRWTHLRDAVKGRWAQGWASKPATSNPAAPSLEEEGP